MYSVRVEIVFGVQFHVNNMLSLRIPNTSWVSKKKNTSWVIFSLVPNLKVLFRNSENYFNTFLYRT